MWSGFGILLKIKAEAHQTGIFDCSERSSGLIKRKSSCVCGFWSNQMSPGQEETRRSQLLDSVLL